MCKRGKEQKRTIRSATTYVRTTRLESRTIRTLKSNNSSFFATHSIHQPQLLQNILLTFSTARCLDSRSKMCVCRNLQATYPVDHAVTLCNRNHVSLLVKESVALLSSALLMKTERRTTMSLWNVVARDSRFFEPLRGLARGLLPCFVRKLVRNPFSPVVIVLLLPYVANILNLL